MSPRQGCTNTGKEISSGELSAEYLSEKQRREVLFEENERPSEAAAAVEAAWMAFMHNLKLPFLQKW